MFEQPNHSFNSDINSAKSIVEKLETEGMLPSEIASRCGVNQSRINGWKEGQKASNESLQKLRALQNMRLPSNKADIFNIAKCVRLALSKKELDSFLFSEFKSLVQKLPIDNIELVTEIDNANSLEKLNLIIEKQRYNYICKQVDLELEYTKREKNLLHEKSPYSKPYTILPSSYQNTMTLILNQLINKISNAEIQLENKKKDEEDNQNRFKMIIENSINHSLSRIPSFYTDDKNLEKIKNGFQKCIEDVIDCFRYKGSYFIHPLRELNSAMERVAIFLDDSQYGPKYGLRFTETKDIYIPECIQKQEDFIEFDDLEFAIDCAKKLKDNFEKFIKDQEICYLKIFKYKEKELGLSQKLESSAIFNIKACEELSSSKMLKITDDQIHNLSLLTNRILKQSNFTLILDGKKYELDFQNHVSHMLNNMVPEPIITKIQISGQLIFSSLNDDDKKESILIYSLQNNDLVLFQEKNIYDNFVLTIKTKLAAEELFNYVNEEIKDAVKQSLMEHGYMFSDIEVLG